jgi:hypothetical protein
MTHDLENGIWNEVTPPRNESLLGHTKGTVETKMLQSMEAQFIQMPQSLAFFQHDTSYVCRYSSLSGQLHFVMHQQYAGS